MTSLQARDVRYLIHPFTNLAVHRERGPLVIDRGEGIYIFDSDGKRYLDGLAGLWCVSLGYNEQRLVTAAHQQLSQLPFAHTFAHRSSPPAIALAEALIALAPPPMAKVFFVNSGSEAVDAAIRFVWYYQNAIGKAQKKKLIARQMAYHGVTVAGGSLTAQPPVQNGFDLPIENIRHVSMPNYYRYGQPGETEEAFSERLAAELDQLILDEGPETVGAFFVEPVMGAGGALPPPRGYFAAIQKVLKKHDVLLVADETITAFGRTGNWWGCQTYTIEPDMITTAKQLSSGYLPIGALLISERIFEAIARQSASLGVFGTGHTYSGHPVAAAVALETLKIYHERKIIDQVRARSERFLPRLRALGAHPLVGSARGVGLVGGIEIVAAKQPRRPFDPTVGAAALVAEHALSRGLSVRALLGDTIAICPPLIIDDAQIDTLFDTLQCALDAAEKQLPRS
ncbi:MAG: aminotransferase class III-fold pyridoxal phosphate-dependent enzyme [Deltaproteobacteria bacterium]|nr:aminotransferase class III-fold pyridoxal phosphate-dependent enzyme [Deltaproteobacteria bacterium]